ncbi:MAG: acyl-CoA synthetase [Acetobacteraceae bacterium]|jgi:acyl-CoA synthetase (AMP-forming)/AMP-acid ligase II|nr:acyl-CoA synthetase [Acetobacteraceae bacterium]
MRPGLTRTTNLGHLLTQAARRFPDRHALIRGEAVTTWAALDARVDAAVRGLRRCGVGKGERILVHLRNGAEMVETMFAAFKLGAIWVPTNVRLTPPEVAYLAASSRAVAMVTEPDFAGHIAAAREASPALRHVFVTGQGGGGEAGWDGLVAAGEAGDGQPREAAVDRDDPLWFFYTSGTTGRPKAAVLTHGQMGFVVTNHLADLVPGTTEEDVSLVVAPLSHGAGIHLLTQVARGAASVLPAGDRLDPEEAWGLVARHRVTNMFTVPTILKRLVEHEAVARHDHASLRHVIYAGAPMYREDQRRALAALGKVIVQYFGLGEVTGNITVLPAAWHSEDDALMPVGSCGFPRTAMEVAILGPDGEELPPGETGEIVARGPAVFAGYFENEEANAKAFAGGWFHTGDLGHLDARGLLTITGRQSDMYISGGSNVYPREIEEVLLTLPGVAEATVVGVADHEWGEAGIAVVVPAPGARLEPASILAALKGRLSRYKHPRRVVVWQELPRSGYGKVPKNVIRQWLVERGEV